MTTNTPNTPSAETPVVTPDIVNLLADSGDAGGCCGGGSCGV